ncbi:MAG: hypothetical protein PHC51_00485 [bacterium]|nr:hypothetical protein [bacterium]
MSELINQSYGTCHAVFVWSIGQLVNLKRAQLLLGESEELPRFEQFRRFPEWFAYNPPPLRSILPIVPLQLGDHRTTSAAELTIYDFGSISVSFFIPLKSSLKEIVGLAESLYDNNTLRIFSRELVQSVTELIGDAIMKPTLSDVVEDYLIYKLRPDLDETSLSSFIESHRMKLAQIIRGDSTVLADSEVITALETKTSYGKEDLAIIDWNAAILFGEQIDDIRTVLEFATVRLLEMRYLDSQLDRSLDRFYLAFSKQKGHKTSLHAIGQLQVDSAVAFEDARNALKILGDHYLAGVYSLAAHRLHLTDWEQGIRRKLEVLESIYQKLSHERAERRMALLEIIIILLIALSIVLGIH